MEHDGEFGTRLHAWLTKLITKLIKKQDSLSIEGGQPVNKTHRHAICSCDLDFVRWPWYTNLT